MIPILCEMSGLESASLICAMIFGSIGCVVGVVALFRKQDTQISPQPLMVEIKKALHDQYADKTFVENHVKENTKRHAEIFGKIDRANAEWRAEIERRFEEHYLTHSRESRELGDKLTDIAVDIGSIKTELKIRNEKKP